MERKNATWYEREGMQVKFSRSGYRPGQDSGQGQISIFAWSMIRYA